MIRLYTRAFYENYLDEFDPPEAITAAVLNRYLAIRYGAER